MTVEKEVLTDWYAPTVKGDYRFQMLVPGEIFNFFGVDSFEELSHLTTEDDDADEDTMDWIEYLLSKTVFELVTASTAFGLKTGGLGGAEGLPPFGLYLVGHGNFESSFPILIHLKKRDATFEHYRQAWLAAGKPVRFTR